MARRPRPKTSEKRAKRKCFAHITVFYLEIARKSLYITENNFLNFIVSLCSQIAEQCHLRDTKVLWRVTHFCWGSSSGESGGGPHTLFP